MTQTITVADVQKISVKDGETLVVFVDVSGRPHASARQMLQEAAKFMRGAVPNPAVQVVAVPAGTYQFGVITSNSGMAGTNSVPLPGPVGQIMNGGKSGNDTDAFDRAMKGLG